MGKGAAEARCVLLMDALHLAGINQEGVGSERPAFQVAQSVWEEGKGCVANRL